MLIRAVNSWCSLLRTACVRQRNQHHLPSYADYFVRSIVVASSSCSTAATGSSLPDGATEGATINNIQVTFVSHNGDELTAKGKIGDSLLDVVVNNDLALDGYGACEGTLACCTCHVVFEPADFNRLPNKPTDEELDMLDLAPELTDTSRLGCQIILSNDLNGLRIRVPSTTRDARTIN